MIDDMNDDMNGDMIDAMNDGMNADRGVHCLYVLYEMDCKHIE